MAETSPKKFEGMIVSDSMDKTVVVEVPMLKLHPKYKKYMKFSKRYKAHDEENAYKVGQRVSIIEVRPISKDKRWRIFELLAPARGIAEEVGEINEEIAS